MEGPAVSRAGPGRFAVAVVLVTGTALSAASYLGLRARDRGELQREFEYRAQERARAIRSELRDALVHVESVAALHDAAGHLDRDSFREFAETMLEGHTELRGLGFNPVVTLEERDEHERAARAAGLPGYRITERRPDGTLVRAADRPSYVVASLLEPLKGNESALGYDIASEPVRREALERARDSGWPAVTGRLRLVQEPGDDYGVLLCVPVYADRIPSSPDDRRAWLRGYAVGVLRVVEVVDAALEHLEPAGIDLEVLDASAPEDSRQMYYHASRHAEAAREGEAGIVEERSYEFDFGGRRWSIRAVPANVWSARMGWAPGAAGAAGLGITVLLAAYVWAQRRSSRRLRREIAERKLAEQQIAGFGRMLDESHEEFYVFDAETLRFLHVNRGARNNLGYSMEELKAMTPLDLKRSITPAGFEELIRPLRDTPGGRITFASMHRRKDGSTYDVEVHLQMSVYDRRPAFVAMILDITDRKRLEERLRQSQRMESLGTLAGGIAHDFNNVLTAISGYTELSRADAQPASRLEGYLTELARASDRARDVVRRILAFSRRSPFERRPLELRDVIREVLALVRASVPSSVEIRESLGTPGGIVGDATQIHQVLTNLCTNAAQAMGERGGVLEVGLDETEIRPADAERLGSLTPGRYVRITVRDTGCGIDPAILGRIFEPFFTTKPAGEGTGMGLAVAHGIVAGHGGVIDVSSVPGRGASFEVLLPHAPCTVEQAPAEAESSVAGKETVLLVDDEPAVAAVLRDQLRIAGYTVEAYTDCDIAIGRFRESPDRFDVVITDHTMPKMTGAQLASRIVEVAPETPVILVSGYGELLDEAAIRASGVQAIVAKPPRLNELARTVRKLFDDRPTDGTSPAPEAGDLTSGPRTAT